MTDITDKDLDMRLAAYDAPEPSELLKARILKAAKVAPQDQVQDKFQDQITRAPKRSFAKRYMGLAASLVAVSLVGFTGLQMTVNSDAATFDMAALQETATEFGFDEIYDWVESEDVTG